MQIEQRKYLGLREAADYTGLPLGFFTNQVKHGTGPAYFNTKVRGAKFFDVTDLDNWVSNWVKVMPSRKQHEAE